jgi:hypothetical protein
MREFRNGTRIQKELKSYREQHLFRIVGKPEVMKYNTVLILQRIIEESSWDALYLDPLELGE